MPGNEKVYEAMLFEETCRKQRPYIKEFFQKHQEQGHEVIHYDWQGGGLIICSCGEQMHMS